MSRAAAARPAIDAPLPSPSARRWFRTALLRWYGRNGRDLPWRRTGDPYHILVSEVMLQQTQVDRVLPKYREWIGKYPSLQAIARESMARFGGRLPDDEATLRSFKGIGPYTAGAVLSFAFGRRAAILDTNVARVLFRVFVGEGDVRGHAMRRHLWEVSRAVLPHRHVFDFNQALMDLGAIVCTARAPACSSCPLARRCPSAGAMTRATGRQAAGRQLRRGPSYRR